MREEFLAQCGQDRFTYRGRSMNPILENDDVLVVRALAPSRLRFGDLVIYRSGERFVVHRFLKLSHAGSAMVLKADNSPRLDPPIELDRLVGKVDLVIRAGADRDYASPAARIESLLVALGSASEAVIFEAMRTLKSIAHLRSGPGSRRWAGLVASFPRRLALMCRRRR